jgi:hypothetical protein
VRLVIKKDRIWAENLCIQWPAVLKQQNESAQQVGNDVHNAAINQRYLVGQPKKCNAMAIAGL